MSQSLTPEEIRTLRGERTRAEFASLLGVSAVSVYRWELPAGEGQSRRPRAGMRARLRALALQLDSPPGVRSGDPTVTPVPLGTPPPLPSRRTHDLPLEELERFLDVFDLVLSARWRDAEEAVCPPLQAHDTSPGLRCFRQAVMALVQLFERGDVRAALTSLQPALDAEGAGGQPAWVAARVHLAAALVFAQPDGLVFHPGRVNLSAARAQELLPSAGAEDLHALLAWARFTAAQGSSDSRLAAQVLARAEAKWTTTRSPLLKVLRAEMIAVAAVLGGELVQARERLAMAASIAEQLGVPTTQFRAEATLTWLELFAGEPYEVVEARLLGARRLADRSRLASDAAEANLEAVAAELHFHRGDLRAARVALERSLECQRLRSWVSPVAAVITSRLMVLRHEADALDGLAAQVKTIQAANAMAGGAALGLYLRGLCVGIRGEYAAATRDLLAAEADVREVGCPLELGIFGAMMAGYTALMAGDLATSANAFRRAEKAFERFPAAWVGGILASFLAMAAAAQGRPEDALLHVAAAAATFERAGDRIQLAIMGRVRAAIAWITRAPGAETALTASDAAFTELGLQVPPTLGTADLEKWRDQLQGRQAVPAPELAARELLVPLMRLSMRGQTPQEIAGELLGAVAEITGEELGWLDEVDSSGSAACVARRGPASELAPRDSFEFGDGCGRRFRLGLVGPVPDAMRPFLQALAQVAGQAMEVAALRAWSSPCDAEEAAAAGPEGHGLVARSSAMRRVVEDLHRLRNSRATVLVTGESGTGKEVVARALHESSLRAGKAYITFNCSTVPADLFEGQLFGYRRGAFTGATRDHPGVIRAADGGTLFLDEVGDLPLELQPKLLRFLENGEVLPLGETHPRSVDVRVVAATHKDLAELVRRGHFRDDLFFRLQVVPVHLAPLRERPEDIAPLVEHFLAGRVTEGETAPRLAPEAIAALQAYTWPGNVREVRNVVDRVMAYSPVPRLLGLEHLRLG